MFAYSPTLLCFISLWELFPIVKIKPFQGNLSAGVHQLESSSFALKIKAFNGHLAEYMNTITVMLIDFVYEGRLVRERNEICHWFDCLRS